jgi:acylphosphatase
VGFRAFCLEAAGLYGVRGWVRNRPDGAVEMEAEASPSLLAALEQHVRSRHPWARVEGMESMTIPSRHKDNEGFDILY